jgi:hypothetical protein
MLQIVTELDGFDPRGNIKVWERGWEGGGGDEGSLEGKVAGYSWRRSKGQGHGGQPEGNGRKGRRASS